MAGTIRALRNSVKSYMGFEDDDLADDLVDDWIRAAMRRFNSETEWPWQFVTKNVTVPANTDLDEGVLLERARRILEVIWDDRPLESMEFAEALRRWRVASDGGPRPVAYTVFGTKTGTLLRLWPAAATAVPVTVRYYEWPVEWPTENTPPTDPFPIYEGAYEAIYRWVLNEALLREAQVAEASTMRAMYHQQVTLLRGQLQVIPGGLRVGANNRVW